MPRSIVYRPDGEIEKTGFCSEILVEKELTAYPRGFRLVTIDGRRFENKNGGVVRVDEGEQ